MDFSSTLIHATAGVSFALYAIALLLRLRRPSSAATIIWTTAFALMAVHVALAFHWVHHWSHREAFDATARQTAEVFGVHWGGGVFANYALLLAWLVEVINWWRGRWSGLIQAFLAFMWFNGTIVFGHGFIRWLGVVVFLMLGAALCLRRRKPRVPVVS
jgi:hypothetical protein